MTEMMLPHARHNDHAAAPAALPSLAPLIRRDILPSAAIAMAILSPALRNNRTTTELTDTLNVPALTLRLVLLAPLSYL